MWSCHEALAFGRKAVQVTVLRLGWNPSASSPGLIDRLFRRREAANRTPPVQPVGLPDGPVPETAAPPVGVTPESTSGADDVKPALLVPQAAAPLTEATQ
jgi:hypothetical protein